MREVFVGDPRQVRGLAIVATGDQIEREGRSKWHVPSQTTPGTKYEVERFARAGGKSDDRWTCSCPDHQTRRVECKHIHAAKFTEAARKSLQVALPGKPDRRPREQRAFARIDAEPAPAAAISCKHCGSDQLKRSGFRSGKQLFRCRAEECKRAFVQSDGFAKLKGDAKAVTLAIDLYFKGNSYAQISDTLAGFFGLEVHFTTVYRWVKRYVALVSEYANTLEPWVGDKWHADEVFTKFRGDMQYLWHVMDADTRYLLVSKVTEQRNDNDARNVMRAARTLAGKAPVEIVTDGLPAYNAGVKELRGAKHTREIHISKPRKYPHNNRVERLNGTVRQRQKVARGLKSPTGPMTKGQPAYYNLVRPHSALDGKTPAEAAGIGVRRLGAESRWAALIREALAAQDA